MLNGFPFLKLKVSKIVNILVALLGLTVLSLVIFSPFIPQNVTLNVGDITQETIVSPRFIELETEQDKEKTEKLREKRGSLVEKIYSIDSEINKGIRAKIVTFFTTARQYQVEKKKDPNYPITETLRFIRKSDWEKIASLDAKTFNRMEYICLQTLTGILNQELYTINKKKIRTQIQNTVKILELSPLEERTIQRAILHYVTPNMIFDEGKTQERIEQEFAAVEPFKTIIRENEPIIYKDETVTQKHISILSELKLYGVKANFIMYIGIFTYGLLMFLLLERFMYYFTNKLHSNTKAYYVIYMISLIVLVLARILLEFKDLKYVSNLNFLIPIPLIAMTISLLFTHNVAMISGTIISIFIALMYKGDFYLLTYLFLSNCVATFATYKIFKRTELIRSGYIIGLFNIFIVITIGLMLDIFDPLWFLSNSAVAFLNGLLSSMIALALLPYLENTFKITTSLALLEQTGLNHPLLKKLMMMSPGTYQHSLMVSNLAEAAAEAIDADVIQTRIGAYFHDVGKIKRPTFFIENQFSGENPHESIKPRMSKIIISAHVKDGLELAEKHKLPSVLKDFISQHHGTSMVSFFYSQALQEEQVETDSESLKEEFRYPGPKPNRKETGIVMLADATEAAVRSLEKPSVSKIENLIEKIFKDKLDDKQLDDCPLSLKEIETIKNTFISILQGIYHSRIDYQEELKSLVEKKSNLL